MLMAKQYHRFFINKLGIFENIGNVRSLTLTALFEPNTI